jgi:anti-anti-sigma regulatory factor
MLKITTHVSEDATRITLEGRLAGPWIGELERCWREAEQSAGGRQLVVDLTGVTFVEQEGKALLTQMCQAGADLLATGCCMRSIVEDAKTRVREPAS